MLRHLHIRNYALIRELDIDFGASFSVLTGETGAGKSIILGALGLIMGNRADSRSITEGEKKCVIEAEFGDLASTFATFFQEHNLDFDGLCIVRRELTENGKSRAFVNDTPVSLALLRELTAQLIDIHSQHENLLLERDGFQLSIVDAVARNTHERELYGAQFRQLRQTEQALQELQEKARQSRENADYMQYQFEQLQAANVRAGEDEQLEREIELLSHAEEVQTVLYQTAQVLDGETNSMVSQLKETITALHRLESYFPEAGELVERLSSSLIELRDIAQEAARKADKTEADPQRLQEAEDRLDTINTLLQKHRLQSVQELMELRVSLQQQLNQIEHYDEQIVALQRQLFAQKQATQQAADMLTATRQKVSGQIAEQLQQRLQRLGMQNAVIEIQIEKTDLTAAGQDRVQFLFAANLNQTPRSIAEIASGGEMARVMLCLKSITAEQQGLPTIIFDEIDTGVSGEVASTMGDMIRQMAAERQVIAITHLPQIAAKGKEHYKVYKTDTAERTETRITHLSEEERVTEIAQLLSGEKVTEAALQNAKELLK